MRRNKNSENITKRKWFLAKYFLSNLEWNSNFNSPKTKVVWPQILVDSQKIQFHILLGFLLPPVLCSLLLEYSFCTINITLFSLQLNSFIIFKQFYHISVLISHVSSLEFTFLFYLKISWISSLSEFFEFETLLSKTFLTSWHR